MDHQVYIYGLIDPITETVRYVGQSRYPQKRLANHISEAKAGNRNHRCNWIRSLLIQDLAPRLVILEACSDNWVNKEKAWIHHYGRHTLVNGTSGGEGAPDLSKESRQRISNAAKRRKTHCHAGHVFNKENTKLTKLGRKCRQCDIDDQQRRRRRKGMQARRDPSSWVPVARSLRAQSWTYAQIAKEVQMSEGAVLWHLSKEAE